MPKRETEGLPKQIRIAEAPLDIRTRLEESITQGRAEWKPVSPDRYLPATGPMRNNTFKIDSEAIALLEEVQGCLAAGLDSFPQGMETAGAVSYLIWSACHINKIAAGYISLRKSGLLHASKILVRPVIESTFSAKGALCSRDFFINKAYTESLEVARFEAPKGQSRKETADLAKSNFSKIAPKGTATSHLKTVTIRESAEKACLVKVYNYDYKLYCQFTHGALGAMSGDLNATTDKRDTPLLIFCILILCEELKMNTTTNIPDLQHFWAQLKQLPDPSRHPKRGKAKRNF
jgi:Family of unknown function (DUF5677)